MAADFVDHRKIATELTQRAIDRIITIGEAKLRDYWGRYKNRDISTYADYLVRKGIQASKVRNFIYDVRSASLNDIYVPAKIVINLGRSEGAHPYTGDDFLRWVCEPVRDSEKRTTRALVIRGSAGTGKSLFFRHAFFEVQKIVTNQIPILIEARNFNKVRVGGGEALADLETRIYEDFTEIGTRVTREQITNGLKSGLFVFLLDGMDELKGGPVQKHYEAELIKFVRKYHLCPVLVSSRPTERIRSWAEIDACDIAPLDPDTAAELVERLEFDENVKARFTRLMRRDLFRTHYEFVSVPLLCTIMLLTYSETGYISKNRHEFFEDAFNALWSKHDARKDGFERDRYTGLQKAEFLKILSAFAISSYINADYNMKDPQFHQHFDQAVRLSGINCKEEDFLRDLRESTSLAVDDGPYIRFCHRAFQEYFAALFIAEMSDYTIAERLIDEISDRLETDAVLPLVLSVNDEKIEKHWILPRAKMILKFITSTRANLDSYARTATGVDQYSAKNGISDAMNKIRILYRFNPSFDILRPAYDAVRDMNIRIRDMPVKQRINVFERDRNNFADLTERLIAKYERRSSALDQLLSQTEPATAVKDQTVT
jgi:hypothetical protein